MLQGNVCSFRQIAFLSLALLIALPALGQGVDVEPNNTCTTAQDMGVVTLPFTIDGELEPAPDVDFFLVTGTAGAAVQIDHEGSATGKGTLGDPLLGVFDSACNQLGIDDDGGFGLNSRFTVTVPADGRLIVAATSFPDFSFLGGGPGSYVVTLTELQVIGSISGRVVNANTGDPLPGDSPPFSFLQLLRCADALCDLFEFVGFQSADSDGRFRFETSFFGGPLIVGTYKVQAFAGGFEFFESSPFDVAEGEDFDIGDVELVPLRLIGSVQGRLVDAVDGQPLPGTAPPFAFAILERCEDFGCFSTAFASADEEGRFRFEGADWLLIPGRYRVSAFAQQYIFRTGEEFDVAEAEHVDVGDFPLEPLPLQIVETTACNDIPSQGGTCRFSVRVRNASAKRIKGAIWGQVFSFGTNPLFTFSQFQVGKVGTTNPMPQKFNLASRQVGKFDFAFDVPGSVRDGAFFCGQAFVGKDPAPHMDVQGSAFLFCISKFEGAFSLMSEKEGHKKFRELQGKLRP